MQKIRQYISRNPLILSRKTWWIDVYFNVADVPVIILRHNLRSIKYLSHVREIRYLVGPFQDEIQVFPLFLRRVFRVLAGHIEYRRRRTRVTAGGRPPPGRPSAPSPPYCIRSDGTHVTAPGRERSLTPGAFVERSQHYVGIRLSHVPEPSGYTACAYIEHQRIHCPNPMRMHGIAPVRGFLNPGHARSPSSGARGGSPS